MKVFAVSSIVIECRFALGYWDDYVNNAYWCVVRSVSNADETAITGIRGAHINGRSNDDVNIFYFVNKFVGFIPSNFGAFFPNIESIIFIETQLTSLSSKDLNQFPNLKSLYMHKNNLTILEADLFHGTPNLMLVQFGLNPLQEISEKIFDGSNQLKQALFSDAGCLNFKAQTPAQLEELQTMFITNCPFDDNQCFNPCPYLIDELRDGIAQLRLENEKLRKDSNERFAELEIQLKELQSSPRSQ